MKDYFFILPNSLLPPPPLTHLTPKPIFSSILNSTDILQPPFSDTVTADHWTTGWWCGWVIAGCLWFSTAGLFPSPGHSTGHPWDLLKLIACSPTADFEYSVVTCLDSWCRQNQFYWCSAGEGKWPWSLWNIYRLSVPGDPTCHPAPNTGTASSVPIVTPCLALLPVRRGKNLNQSPASATLVSTID